MRRPVARGALVALGACLLTPILLVAQSGAAEALVPIPPVASIPASVAGALGIVGSAGTAAAEGVTGVATATAAGVSTAGASIAIGGFGIGYGIGWLGQKGLSIAWHEWFSDHPVTPPPDAWCTTDAGAPEKATCTFWVGVSSSQIYVQLWQGGGTPNVAGTGRCGISPQYASNGAQLPVKLAVTASCLPAGGMITGADWKYWDSGQSKYTEGGFLPVNPVTDPSEASGYIAVNETDCMDVVTGAITTLTRTSDVAGPDTPTTAIPDAICPDGTRAVGSRTKIRAVNSTGTPLDAGTAVSSWAPSQAIFAPTSQYADCLNTTGAVCELRPTTATGDPWTADPNPSTGVVTPPAGCLWGAHSMPVSDCDAMIREVTDPTPAPTTSAPPQVAVPQSCQADPSSADCAADSSAGGRCWPHGWGVLNPLEWVLKPLQCAFIPPPGTFEAGWAKADINWCDTAAGAVTCAIDTILGPFTALGNNPDPNDCAGVAVTLPQLMDRTKDTVIHPLSACSDAAKQISTFWIAFASGAVYLGSVMFGARMLSKTIGADSAVP